MFLLAPTQVGRANHKVGDLYTTEVPGLPTALLRDPVRMELELHRLNGQVLECWTVFS